MKSLFIFRRDLRLYDNIGFIECCKNSSSVSCIFIFTPEQINSNEYFSNNGFQFMLESLHDLHIELQKYNTQLHYYYGNNNKILEEIYKKYKYDTLYFNKDYTVYARKRDEEIKLFCHDKKINCHICEDYLLFPIETSLKILKIDGTPYEKYTSFKNNALKYHSEIKNPNKFSCKNTLFQTILTTNLDIFDKYNHDSNRLLKGGRKEALVYLNNIKNHSNYSEKRNILMENTTQLSAYIKFGCISIREVYHKIIKLFGIESGLINQLFWREFYYYLAYYIPKVLMGKSLKEKYDEISWENNPKILDAWKNGLTGFPIVDAGMRELNQTGYMHNRARLITSGILIKILNCDWRLGEKYFATKLIDYDPIVNNGNWQWSSGSGADSQPFFRILSPWKQAIDYDPECLYIKKWVPELKNVENKDIFQWDKSYVKYKNIQYPTPIVDYHFMRKEIVKIYKKGLY